MWGQKWYNLWVKSHMLCEYGTCHMMYSWQKLFWIMSISSTTMYLLRLQCYVLVLKNNMSDSLSHHVLYSFSWWISNQMIFQWCDELNCLSIPAWLSTCHNLTICTGELSHLGTAYVQAAGHMPTRQKGRRPNANYKMQ